MKTIINNPDTTDSVLIGAAAIAMGVSLIWKDSTPYKVTAEGEEAEWNPMKNTALALDVAMQLQFTIQFHSHCLHVHYADDTESFNGSSETGTRESMQEAAQLHNAGCR